MLLIVREAKARIMRNFENLKLWGRNAKVLVVTELRSVPMSWVSFYQVVFMRSLGLSEVFIGFSIMLSLILQIFLPILGGYLADEFGRKRVLMLFDSGWIGAMITLSIAKEPLQIIVAMLFQGLTTGVYGVWETFLLEDTEPTYRLSIYSLIQLINLFGGLLTPVAGVLVSLYGVEQGCRYIFLIALIIIMIALITRQTLLRESKIGKKMVSLKTQGVLSSKSSYTETLKTVAKHKKLLILFTLVIVGNLQYTLVNTYKPLYLSDSRALALDESIISIVPMASSISSAIALFFIIPRLKHTLFRMSILIGYICGLSGFMVLITAPRGSLSLAVLSAILDSANFVSIVSVLRVFFANAIDEICPFARVKIMSLMNTFFAFVSWPMPIMGGYLYVVSPVLPFVLAVLFLTMSIGLILKI